MSTYSKRSKVHIILHLPNHLVEFGPATGFCTERYMYVYTCQSQGSLSIRYEAFNSLIRKQNVYSNRQSPSHDIAYNFATIEHLRFICSGGYTSTDDQSQQVRYV